MTLDRRRILNLVGVLLLVAFVAPFLAFAAPQAIGAEQSYIVMSGSMSPAINTGDVIFVYERNPQDIGEGDIVTFDRNERGERVTTHRVVEVTRVDGSRAFVTKGDANENRDRSPVTAENVIGVVPQPYGTPASVPYMGHALLFMQSQQGIFLLVLVPAGLLILSEVVDLYRAATGSTSADGTGQTSGEED
jgi:signal peptidase